VRGFVDIDNAKPIQKNHSNPHFEIKMRFLSDSKALVKYFMGSSLFSPSF